jgi:hypothetical protein
MKGYIYKNVKTCIISVQVLEYCIKKIFSYYRLWFYEIIKNLIMNLTLEADGIKDIKC